MEDSPKRGEAARSRSRSRSRSPRKSLDRSRSRSPAERAASPEARRSRSRSRSRERRRSLSRDRYRRRSRSRSRSRDRYRRSPPPRRYSPRRYSPRRSPPRYGGGGYGGGYGRPAPRRRETPPSQGLHMFVAGLNFICTERELERKFDRFGPVREARIVRNPRTGESRGFGFVMMEAEEDVDRAIRALDGMDWNGRRLLVERAKNVK
ncbi:hypothetical protein WJX72_005368 [[Myrmecia] bisecta]|uniref:RRM domain-containing protein n=1 Tax=[Myrmecia] bisecta TaxID=41462 RepID=A0AAW1QRD6_9CHLO